MKIKHIKWLVFALLLFGCAIETVDVVDRFALDYQATEFSNLGVSWLVIEAIE